jgi:spermidine/putrescine-binding protein
LMYASPYFWQIVVFLYHKRAVSDKGWSQIRSVYLIWRNICHTDRIYYIENPTPPNKKKTYYIHCKQD